MKLIRGLINLKNQEKQSVVTIGAFDGLHLGHQAVMSQMDQYPYQKVVILFEPQPKEFFSQTQTPRLSRLRDKLLFLEQQGVDAALCIRFNQAFSKMSAQRFVDEVLVDKLNCQALIVGDDFCFGHQRKGDFQMLQADGRFEVQSTQTLKENAIRVSSSRVRQAVMDGDFARVATLLGRPYTLSGKVAHGDKVGRTWGFPTLNIGLSKPMAVHGVYVVKVHGITEQHLNGVANVGTRPTVKMGLRRFLEVHLLDFTGECYGKKIEVEFLAKLRDERRFESTDLLKNQIQDDINKTKLYFK